MRTLVWGNALSTLNLNFVTERITRLFEKSPIIIVFLKGPRRREKLQWNYTDTFPFVITDRAWRRRNRARQEGRQAARVEAEWSLVCTLLALISRASASEEMPSRYAPLRHPFGILLSARKKNSQLYHRPVRIRDAISSNRSRHKRLLHSNMRESVISRRRGPNHR